MNARVLKFTEILLWLIVFLPLSACALSGGPIDGKVVEEGTNKPIAGAVVVARWIGHLATFAHGKTVCYHVLSATTDQQGRYHLPAWKKEKTEDWHANVRAEEVSITAHHPGYQLVRIKPDTTLHLAPFTGTKEERLRYLMRVSDATKCSEAGESKKSLSSLRRTLYEEANQIAVTKEDRKATLILLKEAEVLELGWDKALQNWYAREAALQ